jgi:hypothetical protein
MGLFSRKPRPGPPGYGAATRIQPEYTVPWLVFRSGIVMSPVTSAAGGGDWVPRNWAGPQQPVIVPNVAAIYSVGGSGSLPARPYFLAPLQGGVTSNGL